MAEQFVRLPTDAPRFMERLQDNLERLFLQILAPPILGSILTHENSTSDTVSATWTQIRRFNVVGQLNGLKADMDGHQLSITTGGLYHVHCLGIVEGSATIDIEIECSTVNRGKHFHAMHAEIDVQNNKLKTWTFADHLRLEEGDNLQLFSLKAGGAGNAVTFKHAIIMAHKMVD